MKYYDDETESSSSPFDPNDYSSSTSESYNPEDDNDDDASHNSADWLMESLRRLDMTLMSAKKRVQFGSVTVREFSVTVGAKTASKERCPLQLDWAHAKDVSMDFSEYACIRGSRVRESNKRGALRHIRSGLRRLSVDQRRTRVATVQGITLNQVVSMEVDQVKDLVRLSMQVSEKVATASWKGPNMSSLKSMDNRINNYRSPSADLSFVGMRYTSYSQKILPDW
jgi:hypothetical protein